MSALALALLLTGQLGFAGYTAHAAQEEAVAAPVLHYKGQPLAEGMTLEQDATLTAHYRFAAGRAALSGSSRTVSLPQELQALPGSFALYAQEQAGAVGIGTADENGNVTLQFAVLDAPAPAEEPVSSAPAEEPAPEAPDASVSSPEASSSQPPEEEAGAPSEPQETLPPQSEKTGWAEQQGDTGVSAAAAAPSVLAAQQAVAGNNEAPAAPTETTPPAPETLTVYFELPCVIAPEAIAAISAEPGQPRRISLPSGDGRVNVVLADEDDLLQAQDAGPQGDQPLQNLASVSSVSIVYSNDDAVNAGDVLYYTDTGVTASALKLRYDFNLTQPGTSPSTADKYIVDIPAGIKVIGSGSVELTAKVAEIDEDGAPTGGYIRYKFGTLYYNSGATPSAYVIFNDGAGSSGELDFWNQTDVTTLTNCWLDLACELDGTAVGAAKDYTFTFYNNSKLKVNVGNNETVPHKLRKTGTATGGVRAKWEVTMTLGTNDASGNPIPTYFSDIIDPNKHIFLPSTFVVKVDGAPKSVSPVYDTTTGKLTCDLSTHVGGGVANAPGTVVAITYETTLTDNEVKNGGASTTLNNTAKMFQNSSESVADSLSASASAVTVSGAQKQWLVKNSRFNPANHTIEWDITVNTMDRNIQDLILYDYYPTGAKQLIAPPTNLKVSIDGGAASNVSSHSDFSYLSAPYSTPGSTKPGTGETAVFGIKFLNPTAGQTYTFTYTTGIDPDLFSGSTSSQAENMNFQNDAWLDFTWKEYNGTNPISHTPPTIGKGQKVHTSVIQKKVKTAYNPATQIIEWEVIVNPHKVNFTSGTITDELPQNSYGWEYVKYGDGKWIHTTSPDLTCNDSDVSNSGTPKMTVAVGALGTNTVSYTFQTKVTPKEHIGYNNPSIDYPNTVKIAGAWGGMLSAIDHSDAKAPVASTVLEKNNGSYNYDTNEVTWTVLVNKNAMPMTGLVLTDVVSAGQSYVTGSAKTAPRSGSGWGADTAVSTGDVNYNSNTRTLKLTLGSVADSQYTRVTFKTRVDVDSLPDFRNKAKVVLKNESVSISRTGYTANQPAVTGKKVEINTGFLNKSYTFDSAERYFDFTVNINKNGLNRPQPTVIKDTLPQGLVLDVDTFELYEATSINAANGNTFTAGARVGDALSLGLCIDEQPDGRTAFSFTLPAGNKRYVLKYRTDITGSNGTYTNDIEALGGFFGGDVGKSAAAAQASGAGGGGGGTFQQRKAMLKLIKTDTVHGDTLQGATFSLYQKFGSGWVCVSTKTTDANGEIVFSPIAKGKQFRLEEDSAAAGFNAASATVVDSSGSTIGKLKGHTFTVNTSVTAGGDTIYVTNEPIRADITFTKVNDWGRPLAGVAFTLTDNAATNPSAPMKATSDAQGVVTFAQVLRGEYTLEEVATSCPQYHTASTGKYTVVVSKSGKVSITAQDNPAKPLEQIVNQVKKCTVVLTVFDEQTKKPLAGRMFRLVDDNGVVRAEGVTDANGVVTFTDIAYMEALNMVEVRPNNCPYAPTPQRTVYTPGHSGYTGEITDTVQVEWPKVKEEDAAKVQAGNRKNRFKTDAQNSGAEDNAPQQGSAAEDAAKQGGAPQTGDNSLPLLPLAAALCVLAGGLLLYKKRQKE